MSTTPPLRPFDAGPVELRPGTPVRQEYRKYDGSPHWVFDTVCLGIDEYGVWLGQLPGAEFSRPGRRIVATAPSATLVPHTGWWVLTLNGEGASVRSRIYIDVTTPSTWEVGDDGIVVTSTIDLDLDVVERFDGTTFVADEDEFADHRVRFGYPEDVAAAARSTADALLDAVRRREEPFGDVARRWLAVCASLAGTNGGGERESNPPATDTAAHRF